MLCAVCFPKRRLALGDPGLLSGKDGQKGLAWVKLPCLTRLRGLRDSMAKSQTQTETNRFDLSWQKPGLLRRERGWLGWEPGNGERFGCVDLISEEDWTAVAILARDINGADASRLQ